RDGSLCLATRETEAGALRSTSITGSELKQMIKNSDARAVVLLLDCCFSGAIGKEFGGIRGGVDDQLRLMHADAQGLHILTASTGTQTVKERTVDADGKVMGAFT